MICVFATMAGFFVSILLAVLLNALKAIKADPEAMAKLTGAIK
jgi:formate/nitrite transporter FocA (FNT family)